MKEFKGTPGPWEFDKSSGRVKAESIDCVVDTCSSDVSPYDLEVDDYNGFLIAAAPDLLTALESLILFTKPSKSNAVALENAHAAIAKALGESK